MKIWLQIQEPQHFMIEIIIRNEIRGPLRWFPKLGAQENLKIHYFID